MKILIADDDAALKKVLCRFFSELNHEALCAATWKEAAGLLEQALPDCVLLDGDLPDGNSADFCARVRGDARFNKMALVVYSGADQEGACAADARVLKGTPLAELLNVVETAVRERR
ncbi:MAG: response regulator [Elusimicrobia bacterium]|nr:response regulator [Elusimicrobiota bacterium]